MANQDMMQIEWNGVPVEVRVGALVESLLTENELESYRAGKALIKDGHGHEVGLRGALNRDERLYLHYLPPPRVKENT